MSDETLEIGTLYEFATTDPRGNPASTEVGWWNGLFWTACFDHGTWAPQYILSFRRLVVVAETYEPAPELGPNERPPFGCCLLIWGAS